ncbi:MAG: acyltransferase family protein [Rhizomicrobium sp.]
MERGTVSHKWRTAATRLSKPTGFSSPPGLESLVAGGHAELTAEGLVIPKTRPTGSEGLMLYNIQALRAAAAFLVVLVHLDRLAELAGFGKNATVFGNSGVDLFFVISGLIMVVTTTERPQTAGQFLRHRIARIAPLYWAVTLAVFVLVLAEPALLQSTSANPVELVKSLAFIPYPRVDGQMHPIVFVGWTLNYEMFFYLMFASGLLFPGKRAGFAFVLGALVVSVVAGRVVGPQSPVSRFYTQPLLLEFGGGMVLGLLLTKNLLPAWRTAAIVIGLSAFLLMLASPLIWRDVDRSVVAGLPALVIVASALMAERGGLLLNAAWLQLLGAASYSIYLTHFFSTQIVVKIADHLGSPGKLEVVALGGGAILLVALVGVIVHRAVELPLTAQARWLLGGRYKPLPQAVVASEPILSGIELHEPGSKLKLSASELS